MDIDKLLLAAVKRGASELYMTVGQPPTLRIRGQMQRLNNKVLERRDKRALMTYITSEGCQHEFQKTGITDFIFGFGNMARIRASIFRQKGNVAMVLRPFPFAVN